MYMLRLSCQGAGISRSNSRQNFAHFSSNVSARIHVDCISVLLPVYVENAAARCVEILAEQTTLCPDDFSVLIELTSVGEGCDVFLLEIF